MCTIAQCKRSRNGRTQEMPKKRNALSISRGWWGKMKKPTNTWHDTGAQSDVSRDCKTFKLHWCEWVGVWVFVSFACVCFCGLKNLDAIRPDKSAKSNLPCVRRFTAPVQATFFWICLKKAVRDLPFGNVRWFPKIIITLETAAKTFFYSN